MSDTSFGVEFKGRMHLFSSAAKAQSFAVANGITGPGNTIRPPRFKVLEQPPEGAKVMVDDGFIKVYFATASEALEYVNRNHLQRKIEPIIKWPPEEDHGPFPIFIPMHHQQAVKDWNKINSPKELTE